jgi:aromatic ring-opening dioxygenase catalytic subunit (LigB family)
MPLMDKALSSLRQEGVLIIGSGMSFDNIRGDTEHSVIFDNWLTETMLNLPSDAAQKKLTEWESAPSARASHPHEEHLLPLHICLGAAGKHTEFAEKIFSTIFFGFHLSAFLWL